MAQIMVGAGGGSYSEWRHRMLASSNFGETPLLALFLITTPKMIPNTEVGHKVLLLNSSGRKSISQEFAHFPWLTRSTLRSDVSGKVPEVSFPSPPFFATALAYGPTQPTLLKTVRMVMVMTVMMK